ncbi:MAG: hypothetical protein IPP06_19035 [Saprospiraceae bacterium]|nr:hypothetical protein [Candidatus Vicinibacter affinis]
MNKPLVAILDSIYIEDQTYRKQIDGIEKIWLGIKRNERPLENHKRKGFYKFNKVKSILDKYGWVQTLLVDKETQLCFL